MADLQRIDGLASELVALQRQASSFIEELEQVTPAAASFEQTFAVPMRDAMFVVVPRSQVKLPLALQITQAFGFAPADVLVQAKAQLTALESSLGYLKFLRDQTIAATPAPRGFLRSLFSGPPPWPELDSYARETQALAQSAETSGLKSMLQLWSQVTSPSDATTSHPNQPLHPDLQAAFTFAASPTATTETTTTTDTTATPTTWSHLPASSPLGSLGAFEDPAAALVRQLFGELRDLRAWELVDKLPLEALREATTGTLRMGAEVESAGFRTVGDVLRASEYSLTQVPGIGQQTAQRMRAAAQTLFNEEHNARDFRISPRGLPPERTIVALLRDYEARAAERASSGQDWAALADALSRATWPSDPGGFLLGSADLAQERRFLAAVQEARAQLGRPLPPVGDVQAAWEDYLSRPAAYQGLVSSLLRLDAPEAGLEFLDQQTLQAIRELDLNMSLMKDVFLRGYQLFGAKFSVVQRRVLLGDEMGLGKTLQAIAAAAHVSAGLRARAEVARVLVVVPASLLLNWKRELAKFSLMSTFVAHGSVREAAVHAWRREGGVLVTTFDTLKTLDVGQPQMVIVDEAHMVKNPAAQRTVAVRGVLAGAEYALMMTGTPLENRREEFATLVSFLDEQVGKEAARQVAPSEFRKAISPVYLRRNQVDVLDELPQKVENEEWVELNATDQQRYFEAIRQGAWMAARRAAIVADGSQNSAPTSAKLERIRELVDEAHEDGKNVLIFSYFRDVLDLLAREFQAVSVGTIDGSVPPARRQEYVDALGKAGHVLLAQITAGGVGLNIQQASVVIFTEVQVKPSLEDQAVARAHRMGQMEVVQVHRIIGDDTVDERLLEVTAEKRAVFDEFARLANSAQVSDAKDVSEIKIAQEIIKAERERLRISDAPAVTVHEEAGGGAVKDPS